MKDNQGQYSFLTLIKEGAAWRVALAALDGDTSILANRLRKGLASFEEMAIAADLIEGKIKPRRPRPGQPSRLRNDEIVLAYFLYRFGHPDWSEKQIKGEVADMFDVSWRHVYNVLDAHGSRRRKFHELLAPQLLLKLAREEIARK
jgi:hypothetical protein